MTNRNRRLSVKGFYPISDLDRSEEYVSPKEYRVVQGSDKPIKIQLGLVDMQSEGLTPEQQLERAMEISEHVKVIENARAKKGQAAKKDDDPSKKQSNRQKRVGF